LVQASGTTGAGAAVAAAMAFNNSTPSAPPVEASLVGHPVYAPSGADGFTGNTEDEQGEFFQEAVKTQMLQRGEWSDNIYDCTDAKIAFCALCCPCVLFYGLLGRSGPVRSPIGTIDKSKYITAFLVMLLAVMILGNLGPTVRCQETIARASKDDEFRDAPSKTHTVCQHLGGLVVELAWWIFQYLVLRAIRDKYQVKEDEPLTFLKAACFPGYCLCFQPCYTAQVARHVDRAQGFVPASEDLPAYLGSDGL